MGKSTILKKTKRAVIFKQLVLFIITMQIEIKIKANSSFIEDPPHCFQEYHNPCGLRTLGSATHLMRESLKLHLNSQAMIHIKDSQEVDLLGGGIWVEKSEETHMRTPFVTINKGASQVWIDAESKMTWIRNFGVQDIHYETKSGTKGLVPAGFELWVSEIDERGLNQIGVIKPIELNLFIKKWYPTYVGGPEEFRKEVQKMRERWARMHEMTAEIYKINAMTQIEEENAARAAELQRRKEAAQYKEMQKRRFLERSLYR